MPGRCLGILACCGLILAAGALGCTQTEGKILEPHYTFPKGAKLQVAGAGGPAPKKAPAKDTAKAPDTAKTDDVKKDDTKKDDEKKKADDKKVEDKKSAGDAAKKEKPEKP